MRNEIFKTLELSRPEQLKIIIEDNKLHIAIEIRDLDIHENPDHRAYEINRLEESLQTLKNYWTLENRKDRVYYPELSQFKTADEFLESQGIEYSFIGGFSKWYIELSEYFEPEIEKAKKWKKSQVKKSDLELNAEAELAYARQLYKGD